MNSWSDLVVAGASVAAVIVAILAYLRSGEAVKSADGASNRANSLKEESNETSKQALQQSKEANSKSDQAIKQSQESNRIAKLALEEAEKANQFRAKFEDISRESVELDRRRITAEQSANLVMHDPAVQWGAGGPEVTINVQNRSASDAFDHELSIFLNGKPYGTPQKSGIALSKTMKNGLTFGFRPKFGDNFSAIPSNRYRVVFTYSDDDAPEKTIERCFYFSGESTSDHRGDWALHSVACEDNEQHISRDAD
jgi:hypothetical protein